MSDPVRLKKAIREAERFLLAAENLNNDSSFHAHPSWPSYKRATAKRASMDLTRALADFRRPL